MAGTKPFTLVLVSKSPRRRQLLAERDISLEVVSPPETVEELAEGEPVAVVSENARRKVRAYVKSILAEKKAGLNKVFLGVDTIVESDGNILGKPSDEKEACQMLGMLSGKVHHVLSAIHLIGPDGRECTEVRKTAVTFRPLTEQGIEWYVSTGEPLDKAGAYGIQGHAGLFIEGIEGCYYNVVGLPLAALCDGLHAIGLSITDFFRCVEKPNGES